MKYTKRVLALFLAMCMVFTSVQLPVNATETTVDEAVVDASAVDAVGEDGTNDTITEVPDATDEKSQSSDETVPNDETSVTNPGETDTIADGENDTETPNANPAVETPEGNNDTAKNGDVLAGTVDTGDFNSEDKEELDAAIPAVTSLEDENVTEDTPVTYADTEDLVDAAIFCSDVHGSTSDASSVFSGIATSNLTYSTASFAGDTFTDTSSSSSTVTSTVQSALGYALGCFYSYGSHDSKSDIKDYTGLLYSGEYYVYGISQNDMASASNASTEAANFTSTVGGLDQTKPLFIISHMPLHARRNDNEGASNWYNAISAAADKMDITFFWAHNHTGETSKDTDAYYVEKDGSETMDIQGGSTVTPNFTYMNAGYINANGQNPARKGVATTVRIYDEEMVFQDYNSSGEYTGTYAHNVTVTREFAQAEEIPEITETKFDFSDNTSDITVTAVASGAVITNVSGDVTAVDDLFTDYAAYDIALTDYTTGNSVAVTMTVPADMDTTNLKVYSVVDGVATEITEYTFENGVISFVANTDGIFVFGDAAVQVPEEAILKALEITKEPDTKKYFTTEAVDGILPLNITGLEVTATYLNGSETISKELVWNEFGKIADGYSLTVDMTKLGTQDVEVSYTYGDITLTDTFEIEIFEQRLSCEGEKVTVEMTVPGVTEVSVVNNTDSETVKAAIADYVTTYVSYNITLTGHNTGEEVSVTLPIPAGMDNPAVYHVSDDGKTVEKMSTTNNGDGTVTFKTTHFSTYVVGESTELTVPDPTTAIVTGATTTEEKTVYVLVSTPTEGNQYIISSSNSEGNAYALKENTTTGTSVTINAAGNEISAPYIETSDKTIMWNAASGMTFQSENGSYYLGQSQSKGSRSLRFSTSQSTNWSVNTNTLSYQGQHNTYYVSGGSTWSLSGSFADVYFYEKKTVTVTTSANGTYSIAGNPAEVSKVVVAETTATLGSTMTFVSESGTTTTTDTSTTATYTVVNGGDPNGIISEISGNTVTFSGVYGKALVKVSYTVTVNQTDYTVDNYITITATEPTYSIDITETVDETEVSVEDTIVIKGVEANDTYELNNVIYYEDAAGKNEVDEESIDTTKLTWVSSNEKIASVDGEGTVTFTGAEGTVQIAVLYEYADGKSVTDVVTFSVSKSQYVLPSDGTDDFPEYPNEGAIRYDKTATAVGNFSQTGIAQVELSMTGVPYTTGSEMDVVLMLDQSTSMDDTRIAATVAATKAFVEAIVINEDGSFNDNRIYVGYFNGTGTNAVYDMTTNEEDGFQIVNNQTELDTLFATIDEEFDGSPSSTGTDYANSLAYCYDLLYDARQEEGYSHQQFCVFMSDGVPTYYQYSETGQYTSASNIQGMFTGTDYDTRDTDYYYEYYSTKMKAEGVTVYSVGLGLEAKNNAWSSASATQCLNAASILLNDISGPAKESSPDTSSALSKKDTYFFSVEDADDAGSSDMAEVFENIAVSIKQAATNVVVQDKVADEYTMVFDIPTGSKVIDGLDGQEFYIEVKEYTLDADHERTSTYTSLAKVYLGEKNGTYYAASDANGTAYALPVFTAVEDDQKGYYSIVDSDYVAAEDEIVIKVDDTYYLFVVDGTGTYNMTSGAYAYGTIDSTTNMSTDLVIVTPYFCYSAATRMLAWTTEKLTTTELALSYFLYLDESATEVGTDNEVDAATYPTNDYAIITYTNYRGKECQQVFPIPQLTWNGAQVSYVFYLVNEAGQPVNRAGKVVPFAEAVYVTDVVTYAVTWNKDSSEGTESLDAAYLAEDLVPDVYALYDEAAEYEVHVYETNTADTLNDYFIIEGSESGTTNVGAGLTVTNLETTKVFNTKAGDRYSTYGAYSATAGTYTDTDNTDQYTVTEEAAQEMAGFDFANTTVAFAVVWKPALVEDTVVVDYGLPVIIDVATNDALASGVVGVRKDAPANVTLNSGQYNAAKAASAALTHGTATVENLTSVRYELSDMTISEPEVFYYESDVNYYSYDNAGTATFNTTSMYSSVTVIPATTVYYEDSFVTYTDSTAAYTAEDETTDAVTYYGTWADDGTEDLATQATDRPGTSTITGLLDANNNYGYDAAYDNCTEYSMGSAKKVTVNTTTGAKGSNPSAAFTFNGTGFDLISLTDNTSGMIKVTVKASDGTTVKTLSVNNYYGYTYSEENGWVTTDSANPNALYQVPVIQITGLSEEPAEYTVTVDVMCMSSMDSTGNGEYNFWLDAVRVYDPASTSNTIIKAAYTADNELNPGYIELRDLLLAADELNASTETAQDGAVFIDGMPNAAIADYEAYGPNNEVYLTKGQAVAFKMIADAEPQGIQIGAKLAQGTSADLYLNGFPFQTLNSATDRNYVLDNITWTQNESGNYESDLIVFSNNSENSIISLTNLKAINAVFVTSNSAAAVSVMSLDLEEETAEDTEAQISVVSSYALARTAVDIVNSIDKVVFVPESLEAFWSSLAVAGRKATLTIMTSEDVEAIDVDGTMITEYKTKKVYSGTFGDYTVSTKRVWTYTITAPEKGTYEYDVIAYDADGNESEPVTTTLNVKGSIWESLFPWLS